MFKTYNETLVILDKKTQEYNTLLETLAKERSESLRKETELQFTHFRKQHELEELILHSKILESSLDKLANEKRDLCIKEADLIQQIADSKKREEELQVEYTKLKEEYSAYKLFIENTVFDIQSLLQQIK